jgi:predicted glutamine amidotransferase
MCRLLGVIANKSVDLEFSLERFRSLATRNPDGWGIGWFERGKAKLFKEGISAKSIKSKYMQLSKRVRSKIIIAHVRKKTRAPPTDQNSHPFRHENWLFAHNGVVDGSNLRPKLEKRFRDEIKGGTDSEVYFYWILQNIEKLGNVEQAVEVAVQEVVKKDHTGLNFLLTDGKSLYAFRYSKNPRKHTLFRLHRTPSEKGLFEHQSAKTKAFLRSMSLRGEEAVLISSERLTNEPWSIITLGTLLSISGDLRIKETKVL